HGAKFVYMAACVWDVERPTLRGWFHWRRALYWTGLKKANAVVAQSELQEEAFLRNFNIKARIIRSFQPPPEPVCLDKRHLLWVGRANPVKRAELFIDLAERLSDTPCVMILNASRDQEYFQGLKERAKRLSNLEFIPYVPHDQIMPYFHQARLFVNTSTTDEGFPNTYLQAFRASAPVMALAADPDGLIRKNNMGFVADDNLAVLENQITRKFSDDTWIQQTGSNAADYLRQNHDPEKLVEEWGKMLEAL
ncbi:TPA: hypothetical protein DDW35_04490, partial [Candidatus Sumerlaeota bacterium]|nr:hypothetical protein [Candidatus Sumerlaeota bacterium]